MSANRACGPSIPHSRPQLGDEEHRAVTATLARSWVGAGGEACRQLESALGLAFGRPGALAVSSGSAALEIALRVTDVAGEMVAIPAFACASIERAVLRAGGHPCLVDVDPDDLSFPREALWSLAGRCKAAIVIHQFGLPAASAADSADLPMTVIEDATTCIGGRLKEGPVGSFGRLVVMSFSATKMLCGGEGGAILGSAADIAAAARWADPESDLPASAPVPHAKMPDMTCALARVQLGRLAEFLDRRAEIARLYDDALGTAAHRVLRAPDGQLGSWWRYLVMVDDSAARVAERGRADGVGLSQPVAERRWADRGDYPVSDRLLQALISVPIYPSLTDSEIRQVQRTLRTVVAAG
jgi:dTDP-4-amino-4,6-dideoxygalactose transaminase